MAKRYYEGARPMHARNKSMIDDAPSKPCNLPTEVMMKFYPESPYDNMGYVDTLYNGVEKQMRQDASDFRKVKSPKKY